MKKYFFVLFFIALFLGNVKAASFPNLVSNDKISISNTRKINPMTENNLIDRFQTTDPLSMPSIVRTTAEENLYLKNLIISLIEVLEEKRILEENDPKLGKGVFHFPKDPQKPAKLSISFDKSNFKLRSISINLKRSRVEGPWCIAAMSVAPRNFPLGIFDMALSRDFFSEFVLERSYMEKRSDEPAKEVNVFLYKTSNKSIEIGLKFVSRTNVSDIKSPFPRSFYEVTIERKSKDCVPFFATQ